MRLPFTQTGWLLIGLMALLYLGALQSDTSLIYLLLGLLIACLLANAWLARRSVRALEIELPFEVAAFEGGKLTEPWHLHNPTRRPAGFCTLDGPAGPLLRIGLVPPGETAARTPDAAPERRGVYPFSSLNLASTYPLGLLRVRRRLQMQGEIVVYPRPYPCEPPPAAGFEPMVGGHFAGARKSRSGVQFTGVRPLQPGDPLRAIHWKSSSKGQGLMVKEYEEELSGRVALFVGGMDGRRLDWAARAAASLMLAAMDRGHHVEMIDLGLLRRVALPPFSDGAPALELLARMRPFPRQPLQTLIDAISLVSSKASLCFVLTEAPFSELPVARRKARMYLPEGSAWTGTAATTFYSAERLGEP